MSKAIKSWLLPIVIIASGFAGYELYKMPKFGKGERAPGFSAQLISGKPFSLRELEGRYVLLDFWGSWCGPCRAESPYLVDMMEKYGDRQFDDAAGFDIVSVAIETNERRWRSAIQSDGLDWPYHIVQLDRFRGPIAKMYGVKEIPTKYILDTDGAVLMVNPSFEEIEKFLDQKTIR